jgi:hypothetical protein
VADRKRFVKSADTKAQAANSRAEVDKILRRYGASAISVSEDITRREVVVSFIIPNSGAKDAAMVPVKLPVSVFRVYDALYGKPTRWDSATRTQVFYPKGYDEKKLAQAERVAWRNLVLWIDAALSAAAVELQTITEAFFAHAVVGAGGERMIEAVEQVQASMGPGVQRLLTSMVESEK